MARSVKLTHPFGGDELLFHRLTTSERLGEPFTYELEVLSKNLDVVLADGLGKPFCVELETRSGNTRYFHGLATEFRFLGWEGDYSRYGVTLRPWLALLQLAADCRVIQNRVRDGGRKVPDIIKDVFRDRGFSDFEDKLTGSYPELEYCVQYRESDFDFVSRLMERYGIYYYFSHSSSKHSLVLADDYGSHSSREGYGEVPFYPLDEMDRREAEHLNDLIVGGCLQTGKVKVNSFDFTKPKADLLGNQVKTRSSPHSDHEVYDYVADYCEQSDGDDCARVRIEARQSAWETVSARGDCCGLGCGDLFTLSESPRESLNKELKIVATTHDVRMNERASVAAGGEDLVDRISIEAMESQEPFRSPERTPVPVIHGPQTAMVVGKKGEEIWTDEHGRVKVQFHWDREGKKDEESSCWVRVAQTWAGKQWGTWCLPRIGQEVVVHFINGDPDQPLVIGSVYNGDNKVPYKLPDNQTQSGIKTRSTKNGDPETYNELRFEDKKGEEEIYFHAQKDFERFVENEDKLTVDEGDQTITLRQGSRTRTLEMGSDSVSIQQGDRDVVVDLGKITEEAMQSIEFKVGANSIKIDQSGVTIKGTMVKVEGTAMTEVKAPMSTVKGDGILTLQGGLTKIN